MLIVGKLQKCIFSYTHEYFVVTSTTAREEYPLMKMADIMASYIMLGGMSSSIISQRCIYLHSKYTCCEVNTKRLLERRASCIVHALVAHFDLERTLPVRLGIHT
jgi:hypothetical protein